MLEPCVDYADLFPFDWESCWNCKVFDVRVR